MRIKVFHPNNLVHAQFQDTMHSGIFEHLMEGVGTETYGTRTKVRKFITNRDLPSNQVKTVSLKIGLLLGAFIIYVTCIGVSFVVILIESVVKLLLFMNVMK